MAAEPLRTQRPTGGSPDSSPASAAVDRDGSPDILITSTAGNSLDIPMARIQPGTFTMGSEDGDWDERPMHKVTISRPFWMSVSAVTLGQYRHFRPAHALARPNGAVRGVNWYDAAAFCKWLSEKECKPYRLPTEAEWEYARRQTAAAAAGSREADGDRALPRFEGQPEWCSDWHGVYRSGDQADPVGPDSGMARIVRGDKLDIDSPSIMPWKQGDYYHRAANRAGMAPGFGPIRDAAAADQVPGGHAIGFRLVQAPMPETQPYPADLPLVRRGVRQSTSDAAARFGPDPRKSYFRKRYLLPMPPETCQEGVARHRRIIDAAGLLPAFRGHNHSPALEVMPNGDVLMAIFTSWNEYEPGMSIIFTRLRLGADRWEMPSGMVDFPDACDNCPLLWRDGGQVYFFWANTRAVGAYPFNWMTSADSGATWSETRYPRFTTAIGPHSRQPINTFLRDREGVIYLPSDAVGAESVLWVSRDAMKTWQDPGGRTGGRHTTFVLLKDGKTVLGMGGKNSDIGGTMPKSISADGGKTWQKSATRFAALGSNQRPCVLRLGSTRLFFCGDFQRIDGASPPTIDQRGSFVALSENEGRTWHIKKLPGTQQHENPTRLGGADTLGYSVARQGPNGMIHLITSMNKPCLHFEMNEAWILSGEPTPDDDANLMANTATSIQDVRQYQEKEVDGQLKTVWHAGIGDDGRYLLHGVETWYYPDGGKQYQATYELGRKVGDETLYRVDGSRIWQWEHGANHTSRWTQWWRSSQEKAKSSWKNFHADGPARTWNRRGKLVHDVIFQHGTIAE